jgi:DNA polymerase type B, organellar and viral
VRRAHWLRPNPNTVIPSRHLVVGTVVRRSSEASDRWELAAAAFQPLFAFGSRVTPGEPRVHTSDLDFWTDLRWYCHSPGQTWIWLAQPSQDLPALRFEGLIQSRLFTRDWWTWSDPPVILSGMLYGRRVMVVGIGNWLSDWQSSEPNAALWCENRANAASPSVGDRKAAARLAVGSAASAVAGILRFVHREDLGHLKPTVGGQSLQAFRHLYPPDRLLIHDNVSALGLERDAALGQPIRQDARGEIPGPIYCCDVNSLYPWVMYSYPYPRKLLWHVERPTVERLRDSAAQCLLIARVSGYDPQREYLVQRDQACRWESDLRSDVLVGPDLDSALSRGVISEVHAAAGYEAAMGFEGWGQWAWELRQRYRDDDSDYYRELAKMLGVALWGAFAGRNSRWAASDHPHPDGQLYGRFTACTVDGQLEEYRVIAGVVDRLDHQCEPDNSCPQLSAYVACYARMHMDNLRAIAGAGNVLYQCADALHVNQAGLAAFVHAGLIAPNDFGQLKVSHTWASVYYHEPNIYRGDDEWTCSGRAVRAVEIPGSRWEWESLESLSAWTTHQPAGWLPAATHRVELRAAEPPADVFPRPAG